MTDHDHYTLADTDPAELAEKREADASPCTTYIRLYLPTGIELPVADGPITPDEEEMFAEWFEDRLHSLFPRLDLRVYWTGVEETKIYIDGTDGIQRGDIFALLTVLYPMWEHAREEDEESDIIIAGRQVPFVQVGMIVHPDDCLNCERAGSPLWCSALVCDIRDDDETARFGMMATLLFRNGERREEPCDELRRRWRMARDFDQARVYTGRWGAIPRGAVWPVAEVNEEA